VALLAGQVGVLSFQLPACFAVIEPIPRRLPVHQLVVPPVVLGVAPGAIVGPLRPADHPGVIAPLRFQPAPDPGVAIETAESRLACAELMAGAAAQRRVQILMRPRKLPGRHLRQNRSVPDNHRKYSQ